MIPSRVPVLAATVLVAFSLPAAALGQEAPTLTPAPGNAVPDRQYVLRLPGLHELEPGDVHVTENGAPVSGQVGVEELSPDAYLLTYRSLLPPEVPAQVRARVEGLPVATTSYTTPELVLAPRGTFEGGSDGVVRPWFVAIVGALSVLAVLAFRARPR